MLAYLLLACILFFSTPRAEGKAASYRYRVVRVYHHDPKAFTQGLIYLKGYLYESTAD